MRGFFFTLLFVTLFSSLLAMLLFHSSTMAAIEASLREALALERLGHIADDLSSDFLTLFEFDARAWRNESHTLLVINESMPSTFADAVAAFQGWQAHIEERYSNATSVAIAVNVTAFAASPSIFITGLGLNRSYLQTTQPALAKYVVTMNGTPAIERMAIEARLKEPAPLAACDASAWSPCPCGPGCELEASVAVKDAWGFLWCQVVSCINPTISNRVKVNTTTGKELNVTIGSFAPGTAAGLAINTTLKIQVVQNLTIAMTPLAVAVAPSISVAAPISVKIGDVTLPSLVVYRK